MKVDQELIAFWKYHNGDFETLLGGTIREFNNKGLAYIPKYQMWVKPLVISNIEGGTDKLDKIKELEKEFSDRKNKLISEYSNKIKLLVDKD